jgi:ribosomal protein S12 methylthiotransferase
MLVEGGTREIVLIGQDISSWGRGLDDERALADLAQEVARLENLEWLRLMYVQPDGISDRLLEVMAAEPTIVEYLDMPLQHVSPRILRAMNRSGSAESFLQKLREIRQSVPGIALRTTFIAGFPGETEEDVQELLAFIDEARFEYAGVFPYSPEEGTPAASLPGLPDVDERLARAQAVRDAADALSLSALAARVGTTVQTMVDGLDEEGTAVGRLRVQAPEVDGLVFLDKPLTPGTVCDVRIADSLGYDLEGTIVT